jgi:hypothetical protein
MAKAHILVLPLPGQQGHVTPLMELSHRLVDHGFEVTFVNSEAHHALVVGALQEAGGTPSALAGIHLASISDGVEHDEDRRDITKFIGACARHMPGHLERLIAEMEAAGRPKVKWLVSDVFVWWSLDVAKRLGIRVASFWPASAAFLDINLMLVRSLHHYGPKAVTGLIPRPGRGHPTNPWLVVPRRTVQ